MGVLREGCPLQGGREHTAWGVDKKGDKPLVSPLRPGDPTNPRVELVLWFLLSFGDGF